MLQTNNIGYDVKRYTLMILYTIYITLLNMRSILYMLIKVYVCVQIWC